MFLCSYVQVYSYVRTHMLWHTYVWLNGSVCTSALWLHTWMRTKQNADTAGLVQIL